jgi:hypothetical protein
MTGFEWAYSTKDNGMLSNKDVEVFGIAPLNSVVVVHETGGRSRPSLRPDLEPQPWETSRVPDLLLQRAMVSSREEIASPTGRLTERQTTVGDVASSRQLTHLLISGRQPCKKPHVPDDKSPREALSFAQID